MKNFKDKKTYTEWDILAARRQGKKEAEECLQKRINLIYITNHQLIVEILRLDYEMPVTGVLVPYKYATKLVRKLKKNKMRGYADRLQKFINQSNPIDVEKVMELLEEITKQKAGMSDNYES